MKKLFALALTLGLLLVSTIALAEGSVVVVGGEDPILGMGEEISLGDIGSIAVDSIVVKDNIAELLSGNRNEFLVVHASFFNMSADTLILDNVIKARLDYMSKVQYDAQYAADYGDVLFSTWSGTRYDTDEYVMTIDIETLDKEGKLAGKMDALNTNKSYGFFEGLISGELDSMNGTATITLTNIIRSSDKNYTEVKGNDGRLIINPITMACVYENNETLYTYNLTRTDKDGYNPLSIAPFEEIGVNFVFNIPNAIANAKSDRSLALMVGGAEYRVAIQ